MNVAEGSAETGQRHIGRLRVGWISFYNRSRSLVARGCAWNETAYPPTTRDLTLWALKTDKSSLKPSNIEARFLQGVSCASEFSNGAHAFMDGPALPVPIFVSFHFLLAGVNANNLVHAFLSCRYYSLAYSALACLSIGISTSASFQSVRKSR
jgi:hypothetical protein